MTIPSNLQCFIEDDYSLNLPSAKRYLGAKRDMVNLPVISISIFLRDAATRQDFWYFWETSIHEGTDKFTIPLYVFGYQKNLEVTMSSVTENPKGNSSVVSFDVKIWNIETVII